MDMISTTIRSGQILTRLLYRMPEQLIIWSNKDGTFRYDDFFSYGIGLAINLVQVDLGIACNDKETKAITQMFHDILKPLVTFMGAIQ